VVGGHADGGAVVVVLLVGRRRVAERGEQVAARGAGRLELERLGELGPVAGRDLLELAGRRVRA
jgi:hypothetical protein